VLVVSMLAAVFFGWDRGGISGLPAAVIAFAIYQPLVLSNIRRLSDF